MQIQQILANVRHGKHIHVVSSKSACCFWAELVAIDKADMLTKYDKIAWRSWAGTSIQHPGSISQKVIRYVIDFVVGKRI